jgi:hypothetical protein
MYLFCTICGLGAPATVGDDALRALDIAVDVRHAIGIAETLLPQAGVNNVADELPLPLLRLLLLLARLL